MKSIAWASLFIASAVLAVSVVLVASPRPSQGDQPAPAEKSTPAKKTTAAEKAKAGTQPADNSSCLVCHANFEDEGLVTVHLKANIGCIKCHGESLPHRNDENNTTPPEIMYPAEAIEPACAKCHETHDAPAKKVIARWKEKCPSKTAGQLVCTDCHGSHHMAQRTVRWDKKTGKLLPEK